LPDNNTDSDHSELESLFQSMRLRLMRYAARYFKRPQDIEDVVQEAFVRVLEAKANREIRVSESYLYRTTRNIALNVLARNDNKLTDSVGDLSLESVLLETPLLEEQIESRQRFELFCRVVRQLPLKCQRVFILRRVYGLSHKEIAQRMGISVKTVENHLTKAIVRCTDRIDAEEESTGS
jgi:RNA polymerase sigma factor (sigma-70 family)